MKKKRNYGKGIGLVLAVAFIIVTQTPQVFASDDKHPFAFEMLGEYKNAYSDARYRQTSSCYNPWKVIFSYSEEGAGTKATFWIARSSDKYKSSEAYTIMQSSLAHKFEAYASANQTNVCLGAENNNYTVNTYLISGYWDEETW